MILKLFNRKSKKVGAVKMKGIKVIFSEHDSATGNDIYNIIISKKTLIDLINTLGNTVTIPITIPKEKK